MLGGGDFLPAAPPEHSGVRAGGAAKWRRGAGPGPRGSWREAGSCRRRGSNTGRPLVGAAPGPQTLPSPRPRALTQAGDVALELLNVVRVHRTLGKGRGVASARAARQQSRGLLA